MKNTDKIINSVKTAAVVTGLSLTLGACNNNSKPLTQKQTEVVEHKVDSAKSKNSGYIMASALGGYCQQKLQEYHDVNRTIAKIYAKMLIKKNITDNQLTDFMLNTLEREAYCDVTVHMDSDCDYDRDSTCMSVKYIRENYRWFNDLMLYLANVYDDRQLLNSGFFDVVENKKGVLLKENFKHNTEYIEFVKSNLAYTEQRKNTVETGLREKYTSEVKSQKQR